MILTVRKALAMGIFFGLFTATAFAAGDAAAGKAVYTSKCKTCHGADGSGNPGMAKMLKVDMKPLSSADIQGMSDADLKGVIEHGKGKMKPISSVTGADLDNVVAYVRSLKK
jgi:mono/diheme cytochrome c family protein